MRGRRSLDPRNRPRSVLVLVGRDKRAEIRRQLTGIDGVTFRDDPESLLESVTTRSQVVLLDLRPPATGSLPPLVVELAAQAPQLSIVIYDRVDSRGVDILRAVATPGLFLELVVYPLEPLRATIRNLLLGSQPPAVGAVLIQRVVPLAPLPLRVFLTIAALKASTGRGVEHLATWSGIPLRTLEGRFHRAGWARPQVIVQAFRALDAAWLIDEHAWSARRVQKTRGLRHGSAVTRLLARYCGGLTPATLRDAGGFESALEASYSTIRPL